MLVHIYGGPGSQQVQQRFQLDYDVFLASSDYIIGVVDGRGTGFRGRHFTQQIYKQLGVLETKDLISAGKFYRENLPIQNLAIWGW
jgi:dipeptidyl aminopeptidase B